MTESATNISPAGDEAGQQDNPNPCVRNCCLDEGNVCLGCGRRLPEILEWHHADSDRREQIRLAAQARQQQRLVATKQRRLSPQ